MDVNRLIRQRDAGRQPRTITATARPRPTPAPQPQREPEVEDIDWELPDQPQVRTVRQRPRPQTQTRPIKKNRRISLYTLFILIFSLGGIGISACEYNGTVNTAALVTSVKWLHIVNAIIIAILMITFLYIDLHKRNIEV